MQFFGTDSIPPCVDLLGGIPSVPIAKVFTIQVASPVCSAPPVFETVLIFPPALAGCFPDKSLEGQSAEASGSASKRNKTVVLFVVAGAGGEAFHEQS